MNFLSSVQIAKRWGITPTRVTMLAKAGQIPGAIQIGSRWMIPDDSQKPIDKRTKHSKKLKKDDVFFRFPSFINMDEKDFFPPLSEEEKRLRNAQIAFHKGNINESENILIPLSEIAENRYVKLAAIYQLCYIFILENDDKISITIEKLETMLNEDFPYKKEMQLLLYGFSSDLGSYKYLLEDFSIDPNYSYHPSAYYELILASFFPISNGDLSLLPKLRYDTYDILCQQMEHEGYYFEAQKLHYLLLIVYQLQNNKAKMEHHIRCGLNLAMEHDLYWVAADYERYYPEPTKYVLNDFPSDFSKKIIDLGNKIHERFALFSESYETSTYLSILTEKEYKYAFLASQGYTNSEIAKRFNVSEKTVSKIYSEIYDKLGISGKKELIKLVTDTHKNSSSLF